MIADGQGQVSGHKLTVRNSAGAVVDTFTFPSNMANSDNQRTILIADTNGPAGADFTWADLDLGQQLTAGAVCFDDGLPPDCIAWGAGFTGSPALPGPTMSAFQSDLPTTNSMARHLPGCNTLLDDADDRNSGDDYSTSIPSPEPNSTVPTENSCPNTQITRKPKAKTTDRTPTFEFTGGDGFYCSLDGSKAAPCDSGVFKPGKLSKGKHNFEVAATELDGSVDGTPAKYSWKIVRKR